MLLMFVIEINFCDGAWVGL